MRMDFDGIGFLEDEYPSRYADLVIKCFLAEGATYNHHLLVSSGRTDSAIFADELPSLKKGKEKDINATGPGVIRDEFSESSQSEGLENMRIAWRYKDAAPLPVTISSRRGVIKGQKLPKFEFTKRLSVKALGGTHLYIVQSETTDDLCPPSSHSLLRQIADKAKLFDLNETNAGATISNNILRIAISHCEYQVLDTDFMFGLRSLVQSTNSCALITLSTLNCDPKLLSRFENLADMVIQLEAIVEDTKRAELGDIDGLCKVQKIDPLNSLKLFLPPSDLGFTYKKKRLTFQVIVTEKTKNAVVIMLS